MKDILVKNVRDETKQTITNIAKNRGTTVSAILRPLITKVIAEAKDSEKRPFTDFP